MAIYQLSLKMIGYVQDSVNEMTLVLCGHICRMELIDGVIPGSVKFISSNLEVVTLLKESNSHLTAGLLSLCR